MLALYHNDMSLCAQKVRVCLAEKKLAWEDRHIVLRSGDHQKPWYVKLNRRAVVPTLLDGDKVITESNVILEYLDEAYPEPPLAPKDPYGRARMRLWTKQLDEDVHDASAAILSFGIAFRHQYLERGELGKRMLEQIPNLFKRERRRDVIEKGPGSQHFVVAVRRMVQLLDEMDEALREHAWLAGDMYTHSRPTWRGSSISISSTWSAIASAWPTGMRAARRGRASRRRSASGRTPTISG
jgi:glutathione S-transferase